MSAIDLQNLLTRRSNVCAELAAMGPTKAGGLPDVSGGGGVTVAHIAYRKSLTAELTELNKLITIAGGPWELETISY